MKCNSSNAGEGPRAEETDGAQSAEEKAQGGHYRSLQLP